MDYENPVAELDQHDCWEMLRSNEFGRIAFHLGPEVHLVPINYAVDGDRLLFRTAPGSKLVGVVMNGDVVFEIDEIGDATARSVVVRGIARRLDEDEVHRADDIGLRPWVPTSKQEVVEIRPDEITGRSFFLERPGRED
jgi:nitroimidazol reductase NimA-like FMN-containing flavoprotein (pyridoxamine 5'-phosphate oxidase superfamily)